MEFYLKKKDDKKKVDNPYVITYYNIEFSPGSYSYHNINDYIKGILILNNHPEGGIKLDFDLSKFKCIITVKLGFVLYINNPYFVKLLGFEEKLYGYTNKMQN